MLPQDPFILLSVVNMKLRDECADLHDLCSSMDVKETDITEKLAAIDYHYDPKTHQFI